MFIVRAIQQGNSLMITIPAKLKIELGFCRADFFQCSAVDTATIAFRKMSQPVNPLTPSQMKGKFRNGKASPRNPKYSHHSHRSKS